MQRIFMIIMVLIISLNLTQGFLILPPINNVEFGQELAKKSAAILPKADVISHKILHFNSVLMDKVLENDYIDMEHKKEIMLMFTRFIQWGDSSGSWILDFYYDLIDYLL